MWLRQISCCLDEGGAADDAAYLARVGHVLTKALLLTMNC